jgi:hypothetical protein
LVKILNGLFPPDTLVHTDGQASGTGPFREKPGHLASIITTLTVVELQITFPETMGLPGNLFRILTVRLGRRTQLSAGWAAI